MLIMFAYYVDLYDLRGENKDELRHLFTENILFVNSSYTVFFINARQQTL